MEKKIPSPNTPEEIIFDANIQEFAARIGIICGLESGGKISQHEAYQRIKTLWKQLRTSKRNLEIGKPPKDGDDDDDAAEEA